MGAATGSGLRVPAGREVSQTPMYKVYAIQSEKDGRIYVGLTRGLEKRVDEHNAGKTPSTKGYRPWKVIYEEECITRVEARKREKYLKSGVGKEFLKSL